MEAIGEDGTIQTDATRELSAVEQGYTYFRDGDLVIAKITPCFENGKGALIRGLLAGIGFGTTELIVVRPNRGRAEAAYLQWLFTSQHFRASAIAAMYGAGGQKRVPDDFVRDFVVAVPTLREQSAIAFFLDRETGKIDALVAEQERLIALLKEKRQAVISQAVTKGLDPNVPMKDSGVEWLGKVPARWKIVRAKTVFRRSELPAPPDAEVVTCFRDGQVTLRRNRREDGFTMAVLEVGYQGIEPDQLVLHSMDAFAGAIGVSDSVGKCSPEYIICIPTNRNTHSQYYGKLLRLMALRGFILAVCPSVRERAPRIRFPEFGDLSIPLPPLEEQRAIFFHIVQQGERLEALQEEAIRAITLLRERRAALISAAVTGKIDVRDHAAA